MPLAIIVAVSENQVIGINNDLPWRLPADLKYFKNLTTGHTVVMGRKTFDSIGKALPNRRNIVLSRNAATCPEGVECISNLDTLQEWLQKNLSDSDTVFIIGGDTIYRQTLHLAETVYLTRVHTQITKGNAFFPELDPDEWELRESKFHTRDEKNAYDYTFEKYTRKK